MPTKVPCLDLASIRTLGRLHVGRVQVGVRLSHDSTRVGSCILADELRSARELVRGRTRSLPGRSIWIVHRHRLFVGSFTLVAQLTAHAAYPKRW